ncbi:hypothetical protein [Fimbriiglobus ruber]|uniref:Uncharacterized protein n=1 Tax=Fimbriiglobus ruber TaxID=1908690 RepID=A0A225E0J3_9BACT|nr:hypothetical protein [Fimbriiglobus ruber]OWK41877.1 hypothetical protein FRUB_03955 [Fimbriiglobus ruber]
MTFAQMVSSRFAAILVIAGGLTFAVGCNKSAPGQKTGAAAAPVAAVPGVPSAAAPGGTPAGTTVDAGPGAGAFAKEFLQAIHDGKGNPAHLTAGFKKIVAEPKTEADTAAGFSDWAAEQWLKGLAARVGAGLNVTTAELPDGTTLATAAQATGRVILRLTKAAGKWQVEWLHVAPPGTGEELTGSGDALASRFATAAFIETALADKALDEYPLAVSLLSPALKARIAPPQDAGDAKRGYNAGILSLKMSSLHGGVTGYVVTARDGGAVSGDLLEAGGKKRPFTLKLTKGPAGWAVDDFEVK